MYGSISIHIHIHIHIYIYIHIDINVVAAENIQLPLLPVNFHGFTVLKLFTPGSLMSTCRVCSKDSSHRNRLWV